MRIGSQKLSLSGESGDCQRLGLSGEMVVCVFLCEMVVCACFVRWWFAYFVLDMVVCVFCLSDGGLRIFVLRDGGLRILFEGWVSRISSQRWWFAHFVSEILVCVLSRRGVGLRLFVAEMFVCLFVSVMLVCAFFSQRCWSLVCVFSLRDGGLRIIS